MDFTYREYINLLKLIRLNGYEFKKYTGNISDVKAVILRHDIDFSLEKALDMALIENKLGVKATYFFMINNNFYNILNIDSFKIIKQIYDFNHSIGIHFDEMNYDVPFSGLEDKIKEEINIFELFYKIKINVVSMHRPSEKMIKSNLFIENCINTYSKSFFKDILYISDSRMNWKQNPFEVINRDKIQTIQMLVHPIWYGAIPMNIKDVFQKFIENEKKKTLDNIKYNIKNSEKIFEESN